MGCYAASRQLQRYNYSHTTSWASESGWGPCNLMTASLILSFILTWKPPHDLSDEDLRRRIRIFCDLSLHILVFSVNSGNVADTLEHKSVIVRACNPVQNYRILITQPIMSRLSHSPANPYYQVGVALLAQWIDLGSIPRGGVFFTWVLVHWLSQPLLCEQRVCTRTESLNLIIIIIIMHASPLLHHHGL